MRLQDIIAPHGPYPGGRTSFLEKVKAGIVPPPLKCGHDNLADR